MNKVIIDYLRRDAQHGCPPETKGVQEEKLSVDMIIMSFSYIAEAKQNSLKGVSAHAEWLIPLQEYARRVL